MKKAFPLMMLLALMATACDGWVYVVPTFPAPPASPTPRILSPTPLFLTASPSHTPSVATPSPSATPSGTGTQPPTETITPSSTATIENVDLRILVEILGCKTSFDLTHGMGEVTDAFIVLRNESGAAASEVCATLYALDEGRPHPDKTVCVPNLPEGHMVTLKLTVDSTNQQATPIQLEIKSGERLLSRVGEPSCASVDLPPSASMLRTPFPIQP